MHVLGLDAGGTKTVCLLADERGEVVARARGAGANLQAAGELAVEKVLHTVMEETLAERNIMPSAICLGIAGVDREDDAAVIVGIMRRIGYKAQFRVVNDALIALVAGAGDEPGVVIIAGTGSIAYGRNAGGEAARAGGWGYVLGDEGSGYWIGRHALRAVVRAADGRGRPTSLTPRILAHFDVARPEALVREVYHRNLPPSAIAGIARQVQEACTEGDAVAHAILDAGARELFASAGSVIRQLDMAGASFPIFLAGGIFQAVPWLATALTERLPELAPHCRVAPLEREPALGAVHLALADSRGGARVPVYRTA